MLQKHLNTLCEELGLPSFDKESAESYSLVLSDALTLSIKASSEGFYLHSILTPVPMQKKEDLYMMLMSANLLGQGTGESSIGMDASEKFLTLSAEFAYEMEYKDFKGKVEDFANYVDFWREEIDRWEKQNQQALI